MGVDFIREKKAQTWCCVMPKIKLSALICVFFTSILASSNLCRPVFQSNFHDSTFADFMLKWCKQSKDIEVSTLSADLKCLKCFLDCCT